MLLHFSRSKLSLNIVLRGVQNRYVGSSVDDHRVSIDDGRKHSNNSGIDSSISGNQRLCSQIRIAESIEISYNLQSGFSSFSLNAENTGDKLRIISMQLRILVESLFRILLRFLVNLHDPLIGIPLHLVERNLIRVLRHLQGSRSSVRHG